MRFATRRDMCYFVGKRGQMLRPERAAVAWRILSRRVEAMGEMDIPKFIDLLAAIRSAAVASRILSPPSSLSEGQDSDKQPLTSDRHRLDPPVEGAGGG